MSALLQDKSGLVTGAADGIGRGVALELASEGASVVVSDLEICRAGGEETVRLIVEGGGKAIFHPCDVTVEADQEELVRQVVEVYGSLDFAVNNAGRAVVKPLADVTESEYDSVLDVNLKGTFFGMKHQIPAMVRGDGGSIVNIGSVASLCAVKDIGIYAASKHGIVGLTKNAAIEYGGDGVRVNAVCPNAIRTPLMASAPPEFVAALLAPQAIKRVGEPEEVGAAVAWLCSSKASYVTGVALPVDGGYLA